MAIPDTHQKHYLQAFDSALFQLFEFKKVALIGIVSAIATISMSAGSIIPELGGLIFLILLIGYFVFRNQYKTDIKKFNSISLKNLTSNITNRISREEECNELYTKLWKSDIAHISVLIGTSGCGKSTLIREDLSDLLESKDWKITMLNEYTTFTENEKLIDNLSSSNTLIVFDQFESLFLNLNNSYDLIIKYCKLFHKIVQSNKKKNHNQKILIVIRKEYLINLKCFQNYLPSFSDIIVIDGFQTESSAFNSHMKQYTENVGILDKEILSSIQKQCIYITHESILTVDCDSFGKNPKIKTAMLPVEFALLVDSYLIFFLYHGHFPKSESFNSEQVFFDYYLSQFPNRESAIQVLYALSVKPTFNRNLTLEEIVFVTKLPMQDVREVLDFYMESNADGRKQLLKSPINGFYDWVHDYYADLFHKLSGVLLDPIARDNINFFWNFKEGISNDVDQINNRKNNSGSWTIPEKYGAFIFIVSFLLLLLRSCGPLIERLTDILKIPIDSNLLISHDLKSGSNKTLHNLDIYFLPIACSLTLWSWYVTSIYRRFYSQLNETTINNIFSIFIAAWSLICVLLTIWRPDLFIVFTGIGGFVIGLKFYFLSKSNTAVLSFDKNYIKDKAKETLMHSLLMATLIGISYVRYVSMIREINSKLPLESNLETMFYILIPLIVINLIMIYFAYLVSKFHISYDIIPINIGMCERYTYSNKTHHTS